ncbi:MAG TPA: hypothetical protein DDY32_00145, partial [Desulfobulbaceae bacterium]|nr:hypothetical protein [Desulfobulbaceae bacterium]
RGAVSVSGREGEGILVWPLFSPDRIDGNRALQLVASLTAKLDRGCRLTPARETMPGVFKAERDPRGNGCAAILIPVRTPRGDAATFILTRTGR